MREVAFAREFAGLGLATLALAVAVGGAALSLPAEAAAPNAAAQIRQGRQLFNDWSCGTCHALKDAGGTGPVGPALDGNRALTKAYVVSRIANGQGAMPGYAGQMTDAEIALLSDYIVKVAKK